MTDQTTKTRIATAPVMDEKQYALYVYEQAKAKMHPDKRPTQADIDAFISASIKLKYTLSAYELAELLLKERAFQLQNAIKMTLAR